MRTWEGRDPDFGRPIAAPLERCADLLSVDPATVRQVAVNVEHYVRVDGTRIWSLMRAPPIHLWRASVRQSLQHPHPA